MFSHASVILSTEGWVSCQRGGGVWSEEVGEVGGGGCQVGGGVSHFSEGILHF